MRLSLRAARASVHEAHRDLVFSRAIARLARDPVKVDEGSRPLLSDLIYGWGNEGWSGQHEFLLECINAASNTTGPILECGSGLTTVLLGVIAQQRNLSVLSLEHLPLWGQRVLACLARHRIESVTVDMAALCRYGGFDWYAPPLRQIVEKFALVVCDGPPSATAGGRYGLLPVMKEFLRDDCLILVDDAAREAEALMVARWASEFGCHVSLHGEEKPYFKVVLGAGKSKS